MSEQTLWLVPNHDLQVVQAVWQKVSPILDKGSEYWEKYKTLDSMLADFALGTSQLWVLHEGKTISAAALTELVDYPQRRVLRVSALAGEGLDEILGFLGAMETWGVRQGASTLLIAGRKGWVKVLEPKGFEQDHVVLAKELKREEMH